jgi:hypothetical protein
VGSGNPCRIDVIGSIIAGDMPVTPPKPPLSLVPPGSGVVSPPRALGAEGTGLWVDIQTQYNIADRGGIELLTQICGAVDVIESLGEAIERDGSIVYARNGVPRAHPGIKDQTALRALVCRGLERLGLNVEAVKPGPGRPSSFKSWVPPGQR